MGWPENRAFSEQLPTLQLAWDSVSLGALKTCPRLYQLSIVEGWRSREEAIDLEFGILAHSGRERYYHAKASGSDHDSAVSLALDFVLTASWDSELDRPRAVFCQDSYKNRFTLARTLVWYLDQWENDPLEQVMLASGKPAVEVSFRFALAGDLSKYSLCGHLDRLVRFNERLWVSDLKTTKSEPGSWFFEHFSPDNQMCQPPGTKISMNDGRRVLIENIKPGDVVLTARGDMGRCDTGPCKVENVAVRSYSGEMITLRAGGKEHKVTPNHRCVVRFRDEAKHKIAVYLMRKGGRFRIGITAIRKPRDFGNGISQRARLEYGDAMWVLGTFENRYEAWLIEQLISHCYGIPDWTFNDESTRGKPSLKQDHLDFLWTWIGDNTNKAKRLLDDIGQFLEYPFWEMRSKNNEVAFSRKSILRACNLKHEGLFDVAIVKNGDLVWYPLETSSEQYSGLVHSLEVEKYYKNLGGLYFANDILTGNSLYSLAGKVVAGEQTAGVIVDAAQVAVGFSRFRRGLIARTEAQLEEWLRSLRVLLRQAEQYARENFWPQNDKACFRCSFRSVCGRTPQVRESILASEFTKRHWDPTQARGDI